MERTDRHIPSKQLCAQLQVQVHETKDEALGQRGAYLYSLLGACRYGNKNVTNSKEDPLIYSPFEKGKICMLKIIIIIIIIKTTIKQHFIVQSSFSNN
jgi:hypothetical protein